MTVNLAKTMTREPAYDGDAAKIVVLTNNRGVKATFMDIGATWLSCKLPLNGEEKEVLLGVSGMADFEQHSTYLGATVGRFANRISAGCFSINGTQYQTLVNQGENILHGGPDGFNRRRWKIVDHSRSSVCFSLVSPDGDQGFPGELKVLLTYTLTENSEISIRYNATTDKATPVNLTNHAYFNLQDAEQGSDCRQHKLKINSHYYLPVDADGIPSGQLRNVQGTNFDFLQPQVISSRFLADKEQQAAKGYDHCYLFDPERDISHPVAELTNSDESIRLSVYTDKPGMQFYTGNWNQGTPRRAGGVYADYSGVALETQFLPDSPNHPEWPEPSSILNPGETYYYHTRYKFSF